jgi:hypothetical protein
MQTHLVEGVKGLLPLSEELLVVLTAHAAEGKTCVHVSECLSSNLCSTWAASYLQVLHLLVIGPVIVSCLGRHLEDLEGSSNRLSSEFPSSAAAKQLNARLHLLPKRARECFFRRSTGAPQRHQEEGELRPACNFAPRCTAGFQTPL